MKWKIVGVSAFAVVLGCMACMELPEEDLLEGTDFVAVSEEVNLDDGRHWHERYVEDSCNRCPECCVQITENGFIDEYGVERPFDWLPEDEEEPPHQGGE